MIAQFPQRPFYSPCKLRAIEQQIAKLRTHKNNQIHYVQFIYTEIMYNIKTYASNKSIHFVLRRAVSTTVGES